MSQYLSRTIKFTSLSILSGLFSNCTPKATTPAQLTEDELPLPSREAIARIAALPKPYNFGNVGKGRALFGECAQCHSVKRGGSEEKGPNLQGIFQRRAAANEHYPYSEALRNSNIVWDVQHLDQWLFNPRETLPGTTMAYIGVRDNAKRRDLLAYLIAISGDTELASSP